MPWPRSERGSPVPKPKARSLVLCQKRASAARKWQATPLRVSCPVVGDRKTLVHCRTPWPRPSGRPPQPLDKYKARTFLFWRGTRMRLRAFGLGTGLPRSDLGQGTWVRVRDLTRYLQRYIYIIRGADLAL